MIYLISHQEQVYCEHFFGLLRAPQRASLRPQDWAQLLLGKKYYQEDLALRQVGGQQKEENEDLVI